jgi:hypothetical protein
MAKTTRKSAGRQHKRPTKTIDLEANPKEIGSAAEGEQSDGDAKSAGSATSGKDDTTKTASQTTPKIQGATGNRTGKDQANKAEGPPVSVTSGRIEAKTTSDDNATEAKSAEQTGAQKDGKKPEAAKKDSGADAPAKKPANSEKGGGTSFLALLVAALIGGGAAVGGSAYLQASGIIAGGSNETFPEAAISEVKSLAENAISAAEDARNSVAGLGDRLSELNQQILSGSGDGGSGDAEAIRSALASEISSLNERVDSLAQSMPAQGDGAAAGNEALSGLSDRVSALESETTGSGNAEEIAQLQDSISQLKSRVDEMATSIDNTNSRIASLETQVNDLDMLVKTEVAPRMDAVTQAAEAATEGQRVARAISARALTAVLDNGGSFTNELAAAETLLGGREAISELQPIAAKGIRSREALVAEFDDIANRVLDAEPVPEGQGLLSKFMESAKSLVKVRPAGPIEGGSPGAVLSRMEAALKAGNLDSVVSEWEALPVSGKTASADWIGAVRDRMTAKRLIGQIIDQLSSEASSQG